jgi:hypothetical protein
MTRRSWIVGVTAAVAIGGAMFAPTASARTVDCTDDYVTSPFVRLKVENRTGVRDRFGVRAYSCGVAVIVAWSAIRRSFPRFLRVYARGRWHSMVRVLIYGRAGGGLFLADYTNRSLVISLTSFGGRIFNPCVLNVDVC